MVIYRTSLIETAKTTIDRIKRNQAIARANIANMDDLTYENAIMEAEKDVSNLEKLVR